MARQPRRSTERCFKSGEAADRKRRAAKPQRRASKENRSCTAGSKGRPRVVDRTVPQQGAGKPMSPRHHKRWQPSGSFRRDDRNRSSARESVRAAEVRALVSTPLRQTMSRPGIRTSKAQMRPSLKEGAETSNASPSCGRVEDDRQSPNGDKGFTAVPPPDEGGVHVA